MSSTDADDSTGATTSGRASSPAFGLAAWLCSAAYVLVVTRVVLVETGEATFGIWATVLALRGFVAFFEWGIGFGIARDAAAGDAARVRAGARLASIAAAGVFVLTYFGASLPPWLLSLHGPSADDARTLTWIVGIEATMSLWGRPALAELRGMGRLDVLAAVSATQLLLGIAALGWFVPTYGVFGAAWATLGSRVIARDGVLFCLRARRARVTGPPASVREFLSKTAPLWLAGAVGAFAVGADVLLVGRFHGRVAAGEYALGATLPALVGILLFAVLLSSFPRSFAIAPADARRVAGPLLFRTTLFAALAFGFVVFGADALLRAWTGSAPPLSLTTAALLAIAWTIAAPTVVAACLVAATGRLRLSAGLLAVEVGAFVFVLATLRMGMPAQPAFAWAAAFAVSAVVAPLAALRTLGIAGRTFVRPTLTGWGLGLAGAAATYGVVSAVGGPPLARVIVGLATTLAFGALVFDLTVRERSRVLRPFVLWRRDGFRVLRRQRAEIAVERARLDEARRTNPIVWTDEPPLVTIRIATYNRGPLVAERAIASALAQTHPNIEVVVVGDCCDERTAQAVLAVEDPRVRFVNLPERGRYPDEPRLRWMVAGAPPMTHGTDIARGDWIAPLDDDDELAPDHVETLLAAARARGLEMVYGAAEMQGREGAWGRCGAWPPAEGRIVHAAVLFSSRIRLRYDVESWRIDEPADWNLWRRMLAAGVRMGFVPRVVCRHYEEKRDVVSSPPIWAG